MVTSDSAEVVASTSVIIAGTGAGAIVGLSVLDAASPTTLWSMVNQMQIFSLLTLSQGFIPDDSKLLLIGSEVSSFNMGFIPTKQLPLGQRFSESLNIEQGMESHVLDFF